MTVIAENFREAIKCAESAEELYDVATSMVDTLIDSELDIAKYKEAIKAIRPVLTRLYHDIALMLPIEQNEILALVDALDNLPQSDISV
jgi:hypothetical protein